MSNDSLGRVDTKSFIHKHSFSLKSGKTLQGFEMVYQTYGELNEAKDIEAAFEQISFENTWPSPPPLVAGSLYLISDLFTKANFIFQKSTPSF